MRIFAQNSFIDDIFQPATIEVSGDVIVGIELGSISPSKEVEIRFDRGYLVPGLIDLQLNGVAGVDFSSASKQQIETAFADLPQTGTTSLCPTVITSAPEQIKTQLGLFSKLKHAAGSAKSLGVHLEGPVISPEKKGAHALGHILSGTQFLASGIDLGQVRILTLAPEVEGANEVIGLAKANNVLVSLGHSTADSTQTKKAKELGASMVTHLFNAMPKIHQREPGIVTAALLDDSMFFGLIVDGEHVAHDLVDLTLRLGADRAVIVSDASAALLAKTGQKVQMGGTEIVVSEEGVAKREDGTLASSGMSQLQAIEARVRGGLSREVLLRSATIIPANVLGESRLGRLAVGAVADIVHYQVDTVPMVDMVLISGEKCPL
jgi:N-acetylglucosamine-6-phosphate deacetylase